MDSLDPMYSLKAAREESEKPKETEIEMDGDVVPQEESRNPKSEKKSDSGRMRRDARLRA